MVNQGRRGRERYIKSVCVCARKRDRDRERESLNSSSPRTKILNVWVTTQIWVSTPFRVDRERVAKCSGCLVQWGRGMLWRLLK